MLAASARMALTSGGCATAEVAARAASARAVMRAFMAGLHWCLTKIAFEQRHRFAELEAGIEHYCSLGGPGDEPHHDRGSGAVTERKRGSPRCRDFEIAARDMRHCHLQTSGQ